MAIDRGQICIIHLIRNVFRLTSRRDGDQLKRQIRLICTAPNETAARAALDDLADSWGARYPAMIRVWENAWLSSPVPGRCLLARTDRRADCSVTAMRGKTMSIGSRGAGTSDMRVLSDSECYELLAVATVGRIGFAESTGIQILPVSYRLGAGYRLFVKTSRHGTIGQLAEANAPVAFEVDYHAHDFVIAWSVLMNGTLGFLDSAASAAYDELRLPPLPWPSLASPIAVQFIPRTISGRELFRH